MSVETFVFLRGDRLPSLEEWQRSLDSIGVDIQLDSIEDLRQHTGYLPAKFNGSDSGFEWYYGPSADIFGDVPATVEGRDYAISFVTHSDIQELICALFAAGALAKVADGMFYDEDTDSFVSGDRAIEIANAAQLSEQERGQRMAEQDASITDRRCPECGAPCPTYRKTCKACGFAIGRSD